MSSAIYPDPPRLVTAVCGHGEQQRLSNARLRLTFLLFPGYSLARARELAPADGAAHLNYAADEFRVEPRLVSARRERQLRTFNRPASRPKAANKRDNRDQQKKNRRAPPRRSAARSVRRAK